MQLLRSRLTLPLVFALLLAGAAVYGRQDFSQVVVKAHPVAGNVSYLEGAGGNIGVSAGKDGVLIVDTQFLGVVEKIDAVLDGLSGDEPSFVINTHWHRDHVSGNMHFSRNASILAHENVRRRMAGDRTIGGRVEVSPPPALPRLTFETSMALHFNGEEIRIIHVPNAHTDGDSVVWFRGSNVVHMGDVYFQSSYPFIDLQSGGSVQGLIEAVRSVLEWIPKTARVVPGHGQPTDVGGLREYLAMLETITERVREGLASGSNSAKMTADGVTADYDERWGGSRFVTPELFVDSVVGSLDG